MPRLYVDNQEHEFDFGGVVFVAGVGAVAATASTAVFTSRSYAVDTSKHAITQFDRMTGEQLREVCDYLGVAYDAGEDPDSKQTVVRAIETAISTKFLTALTVTSAAGTASGDSLITIEGAVGDEGNTFAYKLHATTAPSAGLFKDALPATGWTAVESGADITATTGHKIGIAEINAAGEVVAYGSATITAKA